MKHRSSILFSLALGLLAACGQSGDLTRPGEGIKGTQYLIGSDQPRQQAATTEPAPTAADAEAAPTADTPTASSHGHAH